MLTSVASFDSVLWCHRTLLLLLRLTQSAEFFYGRGLEGVSHIWSSTRQFAKYEEWGEFAAFVEHAKLRGFHLYIDVDGGVSITWL